MKSSTQSTSLPDARALSSTTSRLNRSPAIQSLKIMLVCFLSAMIGTEAFSPTQNMRHSSSATTTGSRSTSVLMPMSTTMRRMSTTVAPDETYTEEKTKRKQRGDDDDDSNSISKYNDDPLEYLEDEMESRDPEDPFHILLLDSTFAKPKINLAYVAGCLNYVLDMPHEDAVELCSMAQTNGMSCLGTWTREECLSLGRDLQVRDLVVRIVPFCEGGNRGWQAKDSNGSSRSNSNSGYESSGSGYEGSSFYASSGFE